MNPACSPIADGAFLLSALRFIDCQARVIGGQGYQALAAPGSPLSLMLAGMLTLLVAFFGYRMLFGQTPDVREGVVTLVKIGAVLALTTSWAAYRPLAYDVALHAPAELSRTASALPGADGGLVERLAAIDATLFELERLGPGPSGVTRNAPGPGGQPLAVQAGQPPTLFGPFALGTARLTFLAATLASYGSVRLVAGLLLALGPFFIAFLLFDGTRALFEGWIRAIAAATLGAVAVTLLLGIELALLEPWLARLIAMRRAELPIEGAPAELLVTTFAFALVLLAGLAAAARIAIAFRLPARLQAAPGRAMAASRERLAAAAPVGSTRDRAPFFHHSRAAALAESISASQRRETAVPMASASAPRVPGQALSRDMPGAPPTPLGQSHRRRTQGRISASAGRRDRAR